MKKRFLIAGISIALAGCGAGPTSSTPKAGITGSPEQSGIMKVPSPQELKQLLPARIPVDMARSMLITVDASKIRLPDPRRVAVTEQEKGQTQAPTAQEVGQVEEKAPDKPPAVEEVDQVKDKAPEKPPAAQEVGQPPRQESGPDQVQVDQRDRDKDRGMVQGRGQIGVGQNIIAPGILGDTVAMYPFSYMGSTLYSPYYLDATLGAYTPYMYSPYAATYPYLASPFVSAYGCYAPYGFGWGSLYSGLWW